MVSSASTGPRLLPAGSTTGGRTASDRTLRSRLRAPPPLATTGLWPAQERAIRNLEVSLAHNRPRALIQMATGSGKTFTAANIAYRLVKHRRRPARPLPRRPRQPRAGRRSRSSRVHDAPTTAGSSPSCTTSSTSSRGPIDPAVARRDHDDPAPLLDAPWRRSSTRELDERSGFELEPARPVEVVVQPRRPDRDVRRDRRSTSAIARSTASGGRCSSTSTRYLIGLTATPGKQTFGFFNQNLVMEYGHEQAVADGVNVDFDVYRIRTRDHRARLDGRGRSGDEASATARPRRDALGEARRGHRLRRPRARPPGRRAGPDPHDRARRSGRSCSGDLPGPRTRCRRR